MRDPASAAPDGRRSGLPANIAPAAPSIKRARFVLQAILAARWFHPLPFERSDCETARLLSRIRQLRSNSKSVRRREKSACWQDLDIAVTPPHARLPDAATCSGSDRFLYRARCS